MYLVVGIEPFKTAQVFGIHSNKKIAVRQAESLENKKNPLCCQRYEAITRTETFKRKYKLYA